MARPAGLSHWHHTVSTPMPHLSRPQVTVWVVWSLGIVLAQSWGLTTVATVLASRHGCAAATRREQLRDW